MCAETAAVDIKKEPAGKDSDNSVPARLARHILHENWYTWTVKEKVEFVKTEVLLGITICFAQIPESVAFAFMAHIKPPVALHAAWVVGLICTLLGGRSGMVNGAEGAFAAIISTLVAEPEQPGQNGAGIELLFPSVIVAGAFMGLFWIFKCYKYISLLAAAWLVELGWPRPSPQARATARCGARRAAWPALGGLRPLLRLPGRRAAGPSCRPGAGAAASLGPAKAYQ